ncbi:MAG: CapA family protein [Deltaproteobacteria bacterium]|nr:CapA family protein [Deltaproteobacteria bacterium]
MSRWFGVGVLGLAGLCVSCPATSLHGSRVRENRSAMGLHGPRGVVVAAARIEQRILTLHADYRAELAERARVATVVFGGDVVPHGDVLDALGAYGAEQQWQGIAPVLRGADLALVNFETPAVPSRPISRVQLQFNVHDDFVQALAQAGIDGASVANNHGYDMGVSGVAETLATLTRAGIVPMGGALARGPSVSPARFTVLGETLCVLAATRLLNFDMPTPRDTHTRLTLARDGEGTEASDFVHAITAARADCAAVIVSLHTGVEYGDQPLRGDRDFFRRCAEAGADAVIGHHSHTPHPVESMTVGAREVPLFYSLGNLLSNQGYAAEARLEPIRDGAYAMPLDPRTREGLLAVLRFNRPGPGRLSLRSSGWVPVWTLNGHSRRESHSVTHIEAALMPREGGQDPMLQARWQSLRTRIGANSLMDESELPGSAQGYVQSAARIAAWGRVLTPSRAVAREAHPSGGPTRSPPGVMSAPMPRREPSGRLTHRSNVRGEMRSKAPPPTEAPRSTYRGSGERTNPSQS